jgi:hypothetical protein
VVLSFLAQKGGAGGRAAWGQLEGGNTPGRLEEEDDPGFPELGCKAVWANWSSGPARMRKQEQVGVPREIWAEMKNRIGMML